jgi:hypothetical protein
VRRFIPLIAFAYPCTPSFAYDAGYRTCLSDAGFICALPATPSVVTGASIDTYPCCYDRGADGGLQDCITTGTCTCRSDGGCHGTLPSYFCPF